MPYITPQRREFLVTGFPVEPGDFNYDLSTTICFASLPRDMWKERMKIMLLKFIETRTAEEGKFRYKVMRDAAGEVACTFLEFKRRGYLDAYKFAFECLGEAMEEVYNSLCGPYEDGKIKENGDVFPPLLQVAGETK